MMKKFLIFVLVLGMASLASATMTLNISVDGIVDPPDSTIILYPSDYVTLDIHSGGYHQGSDYDDSVYFALVADTGYGTISGGVVCIPPAPVDSSIIEGVSPVDAGMCSEPENGIYGWIGAIITSGSVDTPAGIYFDEIVFHCEAPGDVVVKLYTTTDFETINLVDSVIIHQVPEPATIALLGLGGLLLRRRK
jgi:hypothetical protein